jgi:hypothetical protein
MKTHQIFTVIIAIACIFMLTSYKNKPAKQNDETVNNHKIVREYFDGKTFYILLDRNGNAVNFMEKK